MCIFYNSRAKNVFNFANICIIYVSFTTNTVSNSCHSPEVCWCTVVYVEEKPSAFFPFFMSERFFFGSTIS